MDKERIKSELDSDELKKFGFVQAHQIGLFPIILHKEDIKELATKFSAKDVERLRKFCEGISFELGVRSH